MKKEKAFSLGIVAVLALVIATQVPKAKALMIIGTQGTIQQVLGDEDQKDGKEVKIEEEKKLPRRDAVKVQTQEMKQMEEPKQEEAKKKRERQNEKQEQVREGREKKMEGQEEEASKGGEKKVEFERKIYKNGVKIKIEYENGNLVIKREYADGREEYVGKDKEIDVENKKSGTKVRLKSEDNNKLILQDQGVKAKLELPVAVNPDTNELVVTTPAGSKVVAVLPDQAVNQVLGKAVEVVNQVKLTNYQKELAYEVEGVEKKKLLGLFKVKIPKKVVISATTGKVITTQQSLVSRLLDLFAF